LGALLRVFVGVELAGDALSGAVEEVDARPEEIVEVGFEAGVLERGDEGVKDIGQRPFDGVLVGQGPGVGFVLKRTMAVELEASKNLAKSAAF